MKAKTALANSTSFRVAIVAAAITGMVGCNSSSDDSLPISDIKVMPVTDSKLTTATASQLALTLQNGLYLSATGQNVHCLDCQFTTLEAGIADSSARGNYSSTTTQEQGVDKSYRIK